MHPLYLALATVVGGIAAFFVYKQTQENQRTRSQQYNPQKQPEVTNRQRSRRHNAELCVICQEIIGFSLSACFPCAHQLHEECMVEYSRRIGSPAPCPICRNTRNVSDNQFL